MSTDTFAALRGIIATDYALAPESLTPATALKELAIDSLALIELIFTLEDRFEVEAANTPDDFQTLGDVASYIDRLIAERDEAASRSESSA
ncbi:MAG: acyl carrier protein [Luteimonas sp.]